MSATGQVMDTDEEQRGDSAPHNRKPWIIVGAVAAAIALFAGGFLLARNMLAEDADPIASAAEGLVLQQLVLSSEQADQVIAQVGQVGSDAEALKSLAIQLQTIAVQIGDLADDPSASQELRDLTKRLSQAYLTIGVGLVTNSTSTVNDGVELLKQAQADFSAYFGVEPSPSAPAEDQGAGTGTDQGTTDQGTTDQGTTDQGTTDQGTSQP